MMIENLENKERILKKAEQMFLRYGIRSVSMDDIAFQLGMSKKTLYQSFKDKEELVGGVIESHIREMEENCSRCKDNSLDAIHEIFLTMKQMLEGFEDINPVVMYDLHKYHPKCYQRFERHKYDFLKGVIEKNLNKGIVEGLYRPEIDVKIITRYRLESMMLTFNLEAFPPAEYNVANVTREILIHFVYGIATEKGYKLIREYLTSSQS
jgi:TetR/AcrR family transcriptional regulator, cholesterol catabolism regulator